MLFYNGRAQSIPYRLLDQRESSRRLKTLEKIIHASESTFETVQSNFENILFGIRSKRVTFDQKYSLDNHRYKLVP